MDKDTSTTNSEASIYEGEYCFKQCKEEYYEIEFLESEDKEKRFNRCTEERKAIRENKSKSRYCSQ